MQNPIVYVIILNMKRFAIIIFVCVFTVLSVAACSTENNDKKGDLSTYSEPYSQKSSSKTSEKTSFSYSGSETASGSKSGGVINSAEASVSSDEQGASASAGVSASVGISTSAGDSVGQSDEGPVGIVYNDTGIPSSSFTQASYYEALYFTWTADDVTDARVFIKGENYGEYTEVDRPLIRMSGGKARVDIVGLKKGTYSVRIKPNATESFAEFARVKVKSGYDRSGYAHFYYSSGIGAYNDDGTLKDGAVVIYATPETADTVTVPGYEYLGQGIGYLLNTQNSTYYEDYPRGVARISQEHPVCVRIVGHLYNPAGTTERYKAATGWYEPDKENGCQAKINGVKNLTIEGIGTDACIDGWGVAVVSDERALSESVEIRNLTIQNNPEDAVSVLGTKDSSGVTKYPVSRVWVHNNLFNKGHCDNPTESDKADGDGSLDVKKCEWVTLSYNHFNGCKKTGLCGGEDSDKQNAITYHHNWYENCNARCPLARQANIHIYNSYFSGDNSVISARANVYIFSEANYFENCGTVCEIKSGGAVKSFGDVFVGCGKGGMTVVSARDEVVANSNSYGADNPYWANFDTAFMFYYSSSEKKTTVERLTDAATAKSECVRYSGPIKEGDDI